MKKLLIAALIAITLFACNKPQILIKKEMTYEELSKYTGSSNAFKLFERAGKTETVPSGVSGRVAKKVKQGATLTTITDLSLSGNSVSVHLTLSPNAEFVGLNNGTDAAAWDCNRWYAPNETADPYIDCNPSPITVNATGFTSDRDYTIHLSNTLTI